MKKMLPLLFVLTLCTSSVRLAAQRGVYQHGSVIRMHMGDCILAHGGFMVAFGGPATAAPQDLCPEYTLVSNNVVFVIVGKSSNQLIPLTETIDFRIQKNQLAVRVDDAKHENKFAIKEMVVRAEWERLQRHIDDSQFRASEDLAATRTRD